MPKLRMFSRLTWIVCAAMLLGAALRLQHLGDRTMTHVEMWVPGIPLAADLAIPGPRMDLSTVVASTLAYDTHPPAYYVLMWCVTKCFGSGTLAIRLPSVLFGVASIGLVFWLGALIGQRVPGCVAAVFLALNGYHIVWSKTARMYSMLCFLGLLTTILLLLLARNAGRRRLLEISYAALTLVGLCTHVFFWALLATQMVWVLANAWSQNRPMPRLLNIQILVVILGSPLLAFAAYQSGNPVAYLSRNVPMMAREFVQFVYLIPGGDDTYAPDGTPALALAPQFYLPRVAMFLFCVSVLILGFRRLKSADEQFLGESAGTFTRAWLVAAVLAVVAILLHITIAEGHPNPNPTLTYTKAMTPLPLVLFFCAILLRKLWDRLRTWCSGSSLKFLQGGQPLVWMLAVGPFLLLALVSILFRPLMDQRGLLYLAPYLLLTLATGVVALGERSLWLAFSLLLILGTLHGVSVRAYRDRIVNPVDYREFVARLKPHLRDDDLILFRRGFRATPILYYLKPDQHHLAGGNFADARRRNPNARVWVLHFSGEDFVAGLKPPADEYREIETVEVHLARGVLYCGNPCR